MKHAFESCRRRYPTYTSAAYFFHAGGDTLEKTALGLLRSILYQLIDANPRLYDYIDLAFGRKLKNTADGIITWYKEELKEILRYLIKCDHFQSTFLLIDGLDECDGEFEARRLVSFLEDLSVAAVQWKRELRICISSRHYPAINIRKLEVVIDTQPEHHDDIAKYIEDKLVAKDRLIKLQFLQMAQGIFLWVVLVVEVLNQKWYEGRSSAMQKKLLEVPADLEEIFRVLLEKDKSGPVEAPEAIETLLMFQWVLFASRPLKMKELYFAVKAGTDPASLGPWDWSAMTANSIARFITSVSRGLVECPSFIQNAQFIHETVSSYLLRNNILQFLDSTLMSDVSQQSHERLARACFKYIVSIGPQNSRDPRYPFLGYASRNVVWHVRQVTSSRSSSFEPLGSLQLRRVFSGAWDQILVLSKFKSREATQRARADLYILAAHFSSRLMAQALRQLSVGVSKQGRHNADSIQEFFSQWSVRRMQFLLKASQNSGFAPICRLSLLFMIAMRVLVECFWPLTLLLTKVFTVLRQFLGGLLLILCMICYQLLNFG